MNEHDFNVDMRAAYKANQSLLSKHWKAHVLLQMAVGHRIGFFKGCDGAQVRPEDRDAWRVGDFWDWHLTRV